MDPNRVIIFDTTLRDGEQSPGISLNATEKLEIAHQLGRLGVDIIEAGFPIASPGDFEAVEAIAREVHGPVICGLARTGFQDIDAAWNAIKDSERPRIHTFISTSDIHIVHQLQTTREDVLGQARAAVAHAKRYCDDVEFSPMDATRSEIEYTAEVIAVALEEGVAIEVNGLAPRLDLSGEHVRDAIRAGVRIVCSTDAHSVRGLENMELAVRTARRG